MQRHPAPTPSIYKDTSWVLPGTPTRLRTRSSVQGRFKTTIYPRPRFQIFPPGGRTHRKHKERQNRRWGPAYDYWHVLSSVCSVPSDSREVLIRPRSAAKLDRAACVRAGPLFEGVASPPPQCHPKEGRRLTVALGASAACSLRVAVSSPSSARCSASCSSDRMPEEPEDGSENPASNLSPCWMALPV